MEKSMSQGGYPAYPAPKDPRIQVNTSAELNAIPVESRYPKMEVKNLNTDLGTPITSYHELDVAVDADEATKADNNNWRTFFREYDKDHSGMNNRDAAASHPAEAVSYNPAVPGDWNIVGGTPEEVKNGLDRLASSLASVTQATRVTIAPNVYFVDRAKGDDADAVLNNPSKPFETIAAASLAASLESDPTGVYVYAGLYNDVDMMQPGIPMYCDSGVIVYSNQLGNSIVNDSNGAGEYTLLGNARIYSVDIAGSVIFTEGGSIGNIELDEVDTIDFDTTSSTAIIFTLNIKRIKFNLHVGRLARIITNNARLLSGFWTKPAGLYTKASVHFKECLFEFPSTAEYTALLTTEDDEGNVLLVHNANRGITQDATLSSINASIIAAGTIQTSAIQLVGTDATFGDLQTIFDDCVVAIKREHGLGIRLVQTQEGLNGSSRINNAYITSNGLTSASDFSFIATDEAFGRLIPAKVTNTASDTPSSAVLPSGYEWLPNKEKSADLPSEHVRIVTDFTFTDIDGEELVIYDNVGTHTIKLPLSPFDGQKIDISEIQGSELLVRIADGATYTIAGANEIKLIKASSQLKYIKKVDKWVQVGSSSGSGDGVSQLDYHWTAASDGQIDFVIAGASEDEISDILSVHINGSRINPQNATVRTTVISRDTLRVEFADEDDGLILEGDDVLLTYGAVVGAPDNSKAALIKDDGNGDKALFDDGVYKEPLPESPQAEQVIPFRYADNDKITYPDAYYRLDHVFPTVTDPAAFDSEWHLVDETDIATVSTDASISAYVANLLMYVDDNGSITGSPFQVTVDLSSGAADYLVASYWSPGGGVLASIPVPLDDYEANIGSGYYGTLLKFTGTPGTWNSGDVIQIQGVDHVIFLSGGVWYAVSRIEATSPLYIEKTYELERLVSSTNTDRWVEKITSNYVGRIIYVDDLDADPGGDGTRLRPYGDFNSALAAVDNNYCTIVFLSRIAGGTSVTTDVMEYDLRIISYLGWDNYINYPGTITMAEGKRIELYNVRPAFWITTENELTTTDACTISAYRSSVLAKYARVYLYEQSHLAGLQVKRNVSGIDPVMLSAYESHVGGCDLHSGDGGTYRIELYNSTYGHFWTNSANDDIVDYPTILLSNSVPRATAQDHTSDGSGKVVVKSEFGSIFSPDSFGPGAISVEDKYSTVQDFEIDGYSFKPENIAVVDNISGSDVDGTIGEYPYATIGVAAAAAKAAYDLNNEKNILVYVKVTNSTYLLAANGVDMYPDIHYYFEPKTIVRGDVGAGNNIGDQTNGRGKYWIHGKGEFYTADGQFNISYWQAGSDVFWDAHLIHHISTPQGASTGGYPRTNLVCNADYVLAAGNWQGDAGDVGGVMMEFNYTEFLGGIATSTYYNDEWTIKYNRCKFRLSPAIFEPNGVYQYDVVYSDGSAAFSLDMSNNGNARQSRLKDFTSVVTSSQVAIDAVESLNDKVAAAEIFISGSSSGSGRNVNLIFDTCQFIIDQDKAIGLKIAQLTNTTVEDSSIQVLNPVFIDESGGGTDTVAYTAYKGIAVTQDVKLLITNPKSSTDIYKGSHSTPASYPDIELVTLINDSVAPPTYHVGGTNWTTIGKAEIDALAKGFDFIRIIFDKSVFTDGFEGDSISTIGCEIIFMQPITQSSTFLLYLQGTGKPYIIRNLIDVNDNIELYGYRLGTLDIYNSEVNILSTNYEDNQTGYYNIYNTKVNSWNGNSIASGTGKKSYVNINGDSTISGLNAPYTFCTAFTLNGGRLGFSNFLMSGAEDSYVYGGRLGLPTSVDFDGDIILYDGIYTGATSNAGTGAIDDQRYEPVVDLTIPDRWFVDGSNGNDTTGDGTAQNPWRTIQKGINEAVTGDVIVIAKATYSGSLNTTKSITLQGDGDSVLQDTAEMPKIVGNLTATSTSPVVITLIGIQVTTFSATIENTSTGVLVLYISNSIVAPSDGITCSDLDMNISKLLVEYNNDNLRVDNGCKITNSDVICTFGSPVEFVGDLGSFGGSFEFINTSLRNVNVITDQAATIKFTNSYCDGDITTDTGDITQFNSVLSGSITTNGSVIVDNQPDSPHLGAWYVSLGGNDANDGSPQSPFRTIGKAITDSSAGDTIHIQVGAYNETITIDKHLILIGSQFANQGSSSPETTVGITSLTIGANGSGASITGIFANGGLVVTEPSGVTICSINQCFFSGLSTITATTGFLLIDIKDTIFANQLILGGNNVYLDAYDLNIVGNLTIANCDSINLYNCIAKAQVVLTGSATVNMYDGYVEQLNSFSSPATLTIHGTSIYTDNHSGSGTGTLTQKVPWSSGGTTWTDYRYIDPDNGQDNTDAGSPQSPYASLAYAEGQAGTDDTFVLMNGSATGGTFDRSFKLIALNGNFLTTTITIDCNVAARTVEFEGVNFTNTTIAKFGANNLTIIFKNCHGTLTDLTADDLEFYNCTLEKLTSVKTYDTAIINASKITLTGTITIGTSFTLSNSYLIANLSGTATLTLHNSEQDGTIAGTITVDSGETQPLYSDIVAVTTNTTVNFDENVGALVEVSSSAICTVGLRGTPNSDNLTIGDYMDVIDRGTAEVGINTSTSSGGAINGTRPSLGLPKKPNVKNRIYRYVYLGSDTFIVSDVEEATIQVTLTQAQIQALSTTPITVIAAPGTNKIIELISCIAVNNYNTAAFATATLIRLKDATLGNVRMNSSSSFVQATAKRVEQMDHASAVEIGVNEALVVEADADATAGNAASTIELNVKYRVVDV